VRVAPRNPSRALVAFPRREPHSKQPVLRTLQEGCNFRHYAIRGCWDAHAMDQFNKVPLPFSRASVDCGIRAELAIKTFD
jgi:hypothetical protein